MMVGLELIGAIVGCMLACDCCSEKKDPQVTAVDEDLSPAELFHRLRQFHGHIGPYAILGYRLGGWLLEQIRCDKYFGAHIAVTGPDATPYTCLLDGLQMSTGYTLGKGNLVLKAAADRAEDTLFQIEAIAEPGGEVMRVKVPLTVAELFAEWMSQDLTEEQTFDRTLSWPQEELWQEVC